MSNHGYPTMWEHVENLDAHDLLVRVDRETDKDTEMHPLVRWQFRGGIDEADRKAFLFTNVTDANGAEYDIPVVVAGLAGNPEIYGVGIDADPAEIPRRWENAIANPVEPTTVTTEEAPIHDVVHEGDSLLAGNGLERLPIPISTPGWDDAPYTTMSAGITHDPDTGVRNYGMYRAQLKASDRLGINSGTTHGLYQHWRKARDRGEPLPVALCVGAPPAVAYTGAQSLSSDRDELAVAGGLARASLREVEARTVPVMVPADADIVIEGFVPPDVYEPEGQFGESHGHVNLPQYNLILNVTAITHREDPLLTSVISQMTPSESCTMKKVALEPLFFDHLRNHCNLTNVIDVRLHEPLTNLRKVIIVQLSHDASRTEVWRAMFSTISLRNGHGKIVIAVDEDVDVDSFDALFWAMSYRSDPMEDVMVVPNRDVVAAPPRPTEQRQTSAILWDATLKHRSPPISLPKREYMERAREIWEGELDLPELDPESPWHGYDLGWWSAVNDRHAEMAVEGRYFETGEEQRDQQVSPDEVAYRELVYND